MIKVLYIGNSFHIINSMEHINGLKVVAHVCEHMLNNIDGVECHVVNDAYDLEEYIVSNRERFDFAIMYDFGIIVNKRTVEILPIFNFHPGSLKYNRGSSPTNWSILLNEEESEMTLYKISEKIDLGGIVSIHKCKVYANDVPLTLKIRLEAEIPSMLLEAINVKQVYRPIRNGKYRKRIVESDYTIKEEDGLERISAKIRSQYSYKGAIAYINGKKEYVKSCEKYLDEMREEKMK